MDGSGFRNMITTRKRIGAPDDMRGLQVPSHGESRLRVDVPEPRLFRSADPVAGGVPSLQTGVVDGYEHPVGAYMGIKAYEVAKLVALTGHAYTAARY